MEVPYLRMADESVAQRVAKMLEPLVISSSKCSRMVKVLEQEIELGLEKGLEGSSLQMENTYIPELLNGSECGEFLALDLGGTNFRVILLTLKEGKIAKEVISYYSVEEDLRLGPGENLFRFLAACIKDFLSVQGLSTTQQFPLGFTFSFPMVQRGLDVGLLVNWTKSFNCPGVIGEDVVAMLNTALKAEGVSNVKVVAILNDTTGTLVAGSLDYPDSGIGLILGTGTNGAYIERADKFTRWEGVTQCIVDPEWGAWGDKGSLDFIRTEWDRQLDAASLLPGSFTYEKYFAGRYLGELARLVLLGVLKELGRALPPSLTERDSMTTKDVSDIVASTLKSEKMANSLNSDEEEVLDSLEVETRGLLTHICLLLSERAALMVAVPMATFLNRMARPSTTIAVTGSLYKLHPTLAARLEHHTASLSPHPFTYRLCDDGSGKGAGLVAAIASRLSNKSI